jgi:hypothetical protein
MLGGIDNRKEFLLKLYESLINSVFRQKRYFHPKTTKNLIFHLDEIKSEKDKTWVFETLVVYLNKCIELIPEMNLKISEELFDEYLYKLIQYYHTNLGFWLYRITLDQIIIYLIVLSVCYYFFQIWVVLILTIIFLMLIGYSIIKLKKRKAYGIFF